MVPQLGRDCRPKELLENTAKYMPMTEFIHQTRMWIINIIMSESWISQNINISYIRNEPGQICNVAET